MLTIKSVSPDCQLTLLPARCMTPANASSVIGTLAGKRKCLVLIRCESKEVSWLRIRILKISLTQENWTVKPKPTCKSPFWLIQTHCCADTYLALTADKKSAIWGLSHLTDTVLPMRTGRSPLHSEWLCSILHVTRCRPDWNAHGKKSAYSLVCQHQVSRLHSLAR